MRRLLPLLLIITASCSNGILALHPSRAGSEEDRARAGEKDFERFDHPDAAAEFEAMKRGITPGMDVAARYAAANAQMDRMTAYSTVAGTVVDRGAGRRAATETLSQRTILSNWTYLGPGNIGGRTRALLFDSVDPKTMYAAGVSGGIWKTTTGGTSWTPIGDELVNLDVNSMVMDPKDNRTIYAGTGEGYFREDVRGTALPLRGDGIFVTHDAGDTWQQLAFTASNPDFQWVNDLAISSHDSRRIYAATRTGVWRSTDAGATWSNVLPQTVKGGALDLVIRNDQDGDYLFASCGVFEQATVYRNQHAESDGAWTAVLSEPGMSRTSLAVSPSNPSIIYALAASNNPAPDGSTQNLLGVFRSNQNGDPGSWSAQVRVTDPDKLNDVILSNPSSALSPQCNKLEGPGDWVPMGWHCNVIAVDPVNPERVWSAGVDLFRSDDGGRTWGVASYWWAPTTDAAYVHADQHVIAFHPAYNGATNQRMFVTNDAGVFRTDNPNDATGRGIDGGCHVASAVRWTSLINGYGTTQFYHGSVAADGFRFAGGAQDNGVSMGNAATIGPDGWLRVGGGDGGFSAFDPVNQSVLYTESQYAAISAVNFQTTRSRYVGLPNLGDPRHYLFVAPFVADPVAGSRLWVGGDQIWRCDNASTTGTCTPVSTLLPAMVSALTIDRGNADHIVAATNDGAILRTTTATSANGATAWPSAKPRSGYVSSVAIDPFNANVVYATYARFGGPHVWKSTDGGATWSPIDGQDAASIPDLPCHSIAPDPTQPGRLYLGTDLGIFVSLDGGDHWMTEESGLPRVVTEWVTIAKGAYGPAIYAFTHGRGAWRAELMQAPPKRRAIRR